MSVFRHLPTKEPLNRFFWNFKGSRLYLHKLWHATFLRRVDHIIIAFSGDNPHAQ